MGKHNRIRRNVFVVKDIRKLLEERRGFYNESLSEKSTSRPAFLFDNTFFNRIHNLTAHALTLDASHNVSRYFPFMSKVNPFSPIVKTLMMHHKTTTSSSLNVDSSFSIHKHTGKEIDTNETEENRDDLQEQQPQTSPVSITAGGSTSGSFVNDMPFYRADQPFLQRPDLMIQARQYDVMEGQPSPCARLFLHPFSKPEC